MHLRNLFLALGLGLVALAATLFVMSNHQPTPALPVIAHIPDFSLTERSGRTVTRGDLQGRVWVADFIFTNCAGPCPLMSQRMARLQKLIADQPSVRLVSVSVDPDRDTPSALAAYAGKFGADPDRWLFLTGEKQAIHEMIAKGFLLAVDDGFDVQSGERGIITHSTKFVLVDRQGRIRGYYDGADPSTPEQLAPLIGQLVAEPS